MIVKTTWSVIKACVDENPSVTYFYTLESKRKSNDVALDDTTRYWIRFGGDQMIQCFVDKEDTPDDPSDQKEWEDNYKSSGMQT